MIGRKGMLGGLAVAMSMAALVGSGAAETSAVARREPDDIAPEPKRRRGPMPKSSREMSDDYRLTVRAQRGFTTNRIQQLRREWITITAAERKAGKAQTAWWAHLNANRKTDLEKQFAA